MGNGGKERKTPISLYTPTLPLGYKCNKVLWSKQVINLTALSLILQLLKQNIDLHVADREISLFYWVS